MVIKKDSIQTKSPAWTALHDRLAGRGGRLTPQRMAIYEAVVGRTSHPSVAAVHQEVSGAVRRYDGRAGAHVNLVCQRCGGITDVPDVELEAVQRRAASRARFLVAAVRFELHGFCPGCQRSTRRGRGRDARS